MTSSQKIFILDTSVLLSDPYAIKKFAEHEVVVPLVVVKELEGKRNDPLLGFTAREALRGIDAAAERGEADGEDISTGVTVTDEGGRLRIEINHVDQSNLPDALAKDPTHDTRILAVAKNLADEHGESHRVTVISKDMPMRLLAKTLGLGAMEYLNEKVAAETGEAYTGVSHADVTESVIADLHHDGKTWIGEWGDGTNDLLNSGIVFHGPRPSSSAIAVVESPEWAVAVRSDIEAFGINGKSAEQKIALHHLLNPEVGVVSLGGLAGSGKTALAIAAGLEQVMETKRYKKVIIFRPMYAVGGQEMGFLPGTAEEKMSPWAAAIADALEGITSKDVIEEVTHQGLIDVQPLTYIRGRTLHDAFVIVDEAQSLEKPVLLTALTRLGKNSKMVLTHDVSQRDNLRVGRHDGVAAVVERLKGEPLFAHVTFTKSERSAVAEMATRCLDWGV